MLSASLILLAGGVGVLAGTVTYAKPPPQHSILPSAAEIAEQETQAKTLSPVSNVPGIAFDRFYQVWLENTVSCKYNNEANLEGL
jgi:acid phosphatase